MGYDRASWTGQKSRVHGLSSQAGSKSIMMDGASILSRVCEAIDEGQPIRAAEVFGF